MPGGSPGAPPGNSRGIPGASLGHPGKPPGFPRGSPGDPPGVPRDPPGIPGAAAGGRGAREAAGELFGGALSEYICHKTQRLSAKNVIQELAEFNVIQSTAVHGSHRCLTKWCPDRVPEPPFFTRRGPR